MRRLIDEAAHRVVADVESLPSQPAQNVEGATDFARTLIEPLPHRGEAYETLLDFLFDEAIPRSFNAAGPGYLAYVPGGGIYHAAVADYIADAVNRYVGVCAAAPALARIARENAMWYHVDGAYGAFFALTERGRARLRGMEEADSIVLDPHKTLFLPFGTGALVVRDVRTLRRAHSMHADYLPAFQQEDELVDFCELSPELSRDFRGLRVWLPLKMFGIEPFRQLLDEKLDLTRWATDELRKIKGIEIVAEPQLSIVAFRLVRPNAVLNALNHV